MKFISKSANFGEKLKVICAMIDYKKISNSIDVKCHSNF